MLRARQIVRSGELPMARPFRFPFGVTRANLVRALLSACVVAGGCSATDAERPEGAGGAAQGGSPAAGKGGGAGSSTTGGSSGPAGTGGLPSSGGTSGGSTGAGTGGKAPTSGGSPNAGGAAGLGNSGANNAGTSGANTGGRSGGSNAGGAGGSTSGGTSAGGTSGGVNAGGASGSGAGSAGASGGSVPDIPCPAGATFCSGFEGTALPAGVKFHAVGPTEPNPYSLDASQAKTGRQSLAIPIHSGGFYYRALAVPVPGQNFWVRLYVRVSREFGDEGHDSLFGASTGNLDADVNGEALVEFSEQFNEVLLNTDDQLFNPEGASKLTADTWHCVEAHYDSASGDVQIFSDGTEVIHATGYAKQTFQTFRLGYLQYHDTRAVWYDDVVVAPSRVGCN
jgi:hypothetical protein